jgi:acetyl esterase/lipase
MAFPAWAWHRRTRHRGRRRQCRRQSHHHIDQPPARRGRGAAGLRLACVTLDHVDPLIHKPYLEELAGAYAPPPFRRKDPLISPLFADLTGFPPTLIQVGSSEALLDDSVRFARALGLADVNVMLQVWPHMIHAWMMWNAKLAEGREALVQAGAFMRRWLRS